MDLTKVVITGYDKEEGTSDDVNVQTLDSLGRTLKMYNWHDYSKKGKTYYGWFDSDEEEYIEEGDVKFPAGSGVYVVATDPKFTVECNGEVYTLPCAATLRQNAIVVGNPRPCGVDLTTTWVSGYDKEEGTSDDVNVQTLDSLGRTLKMYNWHDYSKKGKTYYGWFDSDEEEYIEEGDMIIGAGESLYVVSSDNGFMLNFPGILQDAPKAEVE